MKLLRCLVNVPDKNTRKEYKAGEIYEFADDRAEELLLARTKVTSEPYFVEYTVEQEITEEVVQSVVKGIVEQSKEENKTIEEIINEIIDETEVPDEKVDLSKLKVNKLKELAKENQVDNYDSMKKEELIEVLTNLQISNENE